MTIRLIFTVYIIIAAFVTVIAQNADCDKAIVLCDNSSKRITSLYDAGSNPNEIMHSECLKNIAFETHSVWFKWKIQKKGILEFNIVPSDMNDDIDFILYKMKYWDDCYSREELRCMASGRNLGQVNPNDKRCLGSTGIRNELNDKVELKGCYGLDDNYLSGIEVLPDEIYILVVNNCTSTHGFTLFFGKNDLIGPPPNEQITVKSVADQSSNYYIISDNVSNSNMFNSIVWEFGNHAIPKRAEGVGPHIVRYTLTGAQTIKRSRQFNNGCTDFASYTLNAKVSQTLEKGNYYISELYPSPTSSNSHINVVFTGSITDESQQFDVVDLHGRIIKTFNIPHFEGTLNTKFSTDGFSPGVYFIKAATEGHLFILSTFVIQ